jgi:fluoride exporter
LVQLILIAGGGFLGAICRYLVDGRLVLVTGRTQPWGTLAVNASGSFLLGLAFATITERQLLSAELVEPVMLGFLGAYTTFSTVMLESWRMVEDGAWRAAPVNLGGSMLVGLVLVAAGLLVGRGLA